MKKERPIVIGVGELLWDLFPSGRQLGGAPANFAFHAQQLGAKGYIISAVGNDENGNEILRLLVQKGMDTGFIGQLDKIPTGTVTVDLDSHGIPVYSVHENVAWDYIPFKPSVYQLLKNAAAFCFGTLAQRNANSLNSIQSFLKALPASCLIVFDVNLRQHYFTKELIESSLRYAHIFKLNGEELSVISELLKIDGSEEEQLQFLLNTYQLRLIALTKGALGSLLYSGQEVSRQDTPKIKVTDTVGAGDAFTAALVVSVLEGLPIKIVHQNAADVAACVASQKGGMPDFSTQVLDRFISNN
jgi:fructokinase